MKKIFNLKAKTALANTLQKPDAETFTVGTEAEKTVIRKLFDNFMKAYEAGDAAALGTFLSEDLLFMTTAPGEFEDKKKFIDSWAETFTAGVPELHNFGEMIIKVAPDGNSGIMVHQYEMPGFFPGLPLRNVYNLIKVNDTWKIFVGNATFIPKNEDIPRIIEALQ